MATGGRRGGTKSLALRRENCRRQAERQGVGTDRGYINREYRYRPVRQALFGLTAG